MSDFSPKLSAASNARLLRSGKLAASSSFQIRISHSGWCSRHELMLPCTQSGMSLPSQIKCKICGISAESIRPAHCNTQQSTNQGTNRSVKQSVNQSRPAGDGRPIMKAVAYTRLPVHSRSVHILVVCIQAVYHHEPRSSSCSKL